MLASDCKSTATELRWFTVMFVPNYFILSLILNEGLREKIKKRVDMCSSLK